MKPLIRKMTINDIESVYQIEVESFTTPWSKESFHKELVENTLAVYFVVELSHEVIGYGGMWRIVDELHITNVAITTEHRGNGYGKMLMKALISFGQQNHFLNMTLEVRESNDGAIALYEQLGFYSVGKRPKYYEDTGEDALVMWKEL